ncbi:MAG TPA: MraY family glycosyltransferase [Clostridia bacterium]|nr:MraY family glycosyltransferase [Clostridia bacterium]
MTKYINVLTGPFLLAFIIALLLTPLTIVLARKINAVDDPKNDRKIHVLPMPRLGGIAIFIATMVSMFYFTNYPKNIVTGISIGAIIIVITGILDDIYDLPATVKLVLQIMAAISVVAFGVRIEIFTNYFGNNGYINLGILGIPATIFWIVGITNTVNLIDGLDGLAAGTAIIASLTLAYIALVNNRVETAVLLVILAGSSLGFLPYNFNPAKVFMGDSGALFLGYFLSVVSILGAVKGAAAIAYFLPVLALGLPIFDTSYAILRRYLNKKPIMQADKEHLHHKLLEIGLNHKGAVLVLYLISSLLGLTAIFYSLDRYMDSLLSLVFVFIIVAIPFKRTSDVE